MDTNRIIINNYDLSTASVESPTVYTGYTVVKASKGPITPVLIPAAGAAKMQDIFGLSSADYPELFEAELYNTQYSLYLSAPYFEADVPVAYLTNKGFYQSTKNLTYNQAVEYLAINGSFQNLEDEIEGINSFPVTVTTSTDNQGNTTATSTTATPYSNVLSEVPNTKIIYATHYYEQPETVTDRKSKGAALLIKVTDPDPINNPTSAEMSEWGAETNGVAFTYTTNIPTGKYRLANLTYKWQNKDYITIDVEGQELKNNNKCIGELLLCNGYKEFTREYKNNEWVIKSAVTGLNTPAFTGNASKSYYFDPAIYNLLAADPGLYLFFYGTQDVYPEGHEKEGQYIPDQAGLSPIDLDKRLDEEKERADLILYKEVSLYDELGLTAGTDDLADHIYAVIFPKYPSENALHIEFTPFDQRNYKANSPEARNTLKITAYEEKAFHSSKGLAVTFNGSLGRINGTYPAFNATNSGYMEQNLVAVYSDRKFQNKGDLDNGSLSLPGYGSLLLKNGTRKVEAGTYDNTFKTSTDLHNLGWAKATEAEYVDVDIFFDSQRHYVSEGEFSLGLGYQDSIINKEIKGQSGTATGAANMDKNTFFSLAAKRQTSGFLFNYTVDPKVLTVSNSDVQQYQLNLGGNNGRQYWNVCNELVIDLVDGSRFMSPMTGARALMQTRIIEYKYGGVAPEWTNSGTPSMGGQFVGLTSTRLRFRYDKDQQDMLDQMNFNPVISDRTYGLMLTGHKTCQSGDLTDWSYIGHACSFLAFEKEVRRLVMNPQLGKPNNPYYRDLRKFQVEELLAKRLQGSGRIWAFGDCDTSTADGVNDNQALRAKQFRIKVRVKVDIYSEYVILDFYNLDQDAVV